VLALAIPMRPGLAMSGLARMLSGDGIDRCSIFFAED